MCTWIVETLGMQTVLVHECDETRPGDGNNLLSQDIGGGYVRCARCGEKYLPAALPGNPRLLLRIKNRSEVCQPPFHA